MLHCARRRIIALCIISSLCTDALAGWGMPVAFDIRALPLDAAVQVLGRQAGLQILWPEGLPGEKRRVARLHERLTPEEALARLLAGTQIRYTFVSPDMVTFQSAVPEPTTPGPSFSRFAPVTADYSKAARIPDVVISGSRSLNADIRRTADDARPVQVIDSSRIALSPARTLPELLRMELTSLDTPATRPGSNVLAAEIDQINLRGMGGPQTLILIDGRRVAGRSLGADSQQPDLALIPLESIKRIEVLSATASARYGGGPAGGVINIVLKQDAPGTRMSVRVGEPAHRSPEMRQVWAEHVHAFDQSRGRLAISGTWSEQSDIPLRNTDFFTRGRMTRAQNDPEFVRSTALPPLGRRTNVRTADGSPILPAGSAPNLYIPDGYQRSQGLAPLEATQGQYDYGLADSAQAFGGARASLRPAVKVRSVTTTARWAFTDVFTADLGFGYGKVTRSATTSGADYALAAGTFLPASATTNPFGKDVIFTVPFSSGDALMESEDRARRALAAVTAQVSQNWVARLEYSWSSSTLALRRPVLLGAGDPMAQGFDPFTTPVREADAGLQAGTLLTTPVRSTMDSTMLGLAGTPFRLPAGAAWLTLRAEQRRDWLAQGSAFRTLLIPGAAALVQSVIPEQRAVTDSGYAELQLPLYRSSNEGSHASLQAEISVHSDHARIHAAGESDPAAPASTQSASNFGAHSWLTALKFSPAEFLLMRAGCGTGFVPPPMSELTMPVTRRIDTPFFIDPLRGELAAGFDVIAGGDPSLRPERSRSCSGGVVLEIAEQGALRVSADYTSTSKDDVVFVPVALLFTDPEAFLAQFSDYIVRAPDDQGVPGRILRILGTARNLSHQDIHAWDLAFDSRIGAGAGTLGLSLRATIQSVFATRLNATAPLVNDAGVGPLAPPLWRANASITYARGPWELGWSTRYVPHYRVSRDEALIKGQGDRHVPGQDYHDFYGRYTFQTRDGGPAFHVQFGIRNILRRSPPFDVTSSDYASRQGATEIPSYELSLGADF